MIPGGNIRRVMQGRLTGFRTAGVLLLTLTLASGGPGMLAHGNGETLSAQDDAVPSPCDFVTSGGFVVTDSGRKANFGAHGGCKNGEFWGHVNYVDHATGYHVTSIEITGYSTPAPGSNIRDVCGIADTNIESEGPVRFRVRLVDNDQEGLFGIRLSNNYLVTTRPLGTGQRGGGKVQIHEPNPSTTAPVPEPDIESMCAGVPPPARPEE